MKASAPVAPVEESIAAGTPVMRKASVKETQVLSGLSGGFRRKGRVTPVSRLSLAKIGN